MEYRIIDEAEIPASRSVRSRYADVYAALETLPAGKWLAIDVPEGDLPSTLGTAIAQSARQGRRPYTITYRTDKIRHLLYVSKK